MTRLSSDSVVPIDGRSLTVERVVDVSRGSARVAATDETIARLGESRALLERLISERGAIYGVTTGYGSLADVRVPDDQIRALQTNLVRSHAAGVGPLLPVETVRAALLLRANSLAVGASGIRPIVVETLCEMLNLRLHPAIHSIGSLGASGDLAPLADIALCLIGEGKVLSDEGTAASREAFARAGVGTLVLMAKEGIALLNGTAVTTGVACTALFDAERLVSTAEVVAAVTAQALRSRSDSFAAGAIALRPHPGALASSARLRGLLAGSSLVDSDTARVQDAYSIRCLPQVLGAVRDAVAPVRKAVEVEINSATDNPLLVDDHVVSAGNFHGAPIALPLDSLAIAMAQIGIGSERRAYRLLDPALSAGLPPMLAENAGVECGLMIAQYTSAALLRCLKACAQPSSADSVPTSAGQEDHVPFALHSALSAREAVEHAARIVAIEAVCAARAVDIRRRRKEGEPSRATADVIEALRTKVPERTCDAVLSADLESVYELVADGTLLDAAGV